MKRTESASYSSTVKVNAAAADVFRALTREMDRWWSTHCDGSVDTIGARATISFPPDNGYWTFEAVVLEPDRLVELRCVEARHLVAGHPEIEQEWLGTRLRWQLEETPTGTEVTLEHSGLTPDLSCYGMCVAGWSHFFETSLAALLEEGSGMPHRQLD